MQLAASETARFYRIWFALLHYVNERRGLLAVFPLRPDEGALQPSDAVALRNALWADDTLRERFIGDNPAALPPADLALVASWQHRVMGRFFIERYLKEHTIFLSEAPPRAYGVLGLASPIAEIVGPYVPIYVEAVLLPFERRIIYDSLLAPFAITFGGGIRQRLRDAYRDAQEREGLITTLPPAESQNRATVQAALRQRNAKVITAFRKDLSRRGLTAQTVAGHVRLISNFADEYLLQQDPPRGLLTLTPQDVRQYVPLAAANPVSFRHFVRFLDVTGRLHPPITVDLLNALKPT